MNRRAILQSLIIPSFAGVAGCQYEGSGQEVPRTTQTDTPVETSTETPTQTPTETPTETETPEDSTYYIATDGDDSNSGFRDQPLATIQEGLDRSQPGDTVYVTPGECQESEGAWQSPVTVRDGEPDAPITIMGPEDAVLRPAQKGSALRIKNSHIRLRGMTFDGLLDPENPDSPESYGDGKIISVIPRDGEENVEDIVVAPDAIGNSRGTLILVQRTTNIELGPFRVMGLAGADYVLGEKKTHVGEVIYLGQPLTEEREGYPWDTIDYTNNVHVHHIDNSEGHPHSELVNAKIGTYDILVEYCTSHGGAHNNDHTPNAEIRFENSDSTLRWCDLRNGEAMAAYLWGAMDEPISERRDPKRLSTRVGRGQSVYGNSLQGFGDIAIEGPGHGKNTICGNDYTGQGGVATGEECPEKVPKGDGVGHLGGDSPWA